MHGRKWVSKHGGATVLETRGGRRTGLSQRSSIIKEEGGSDGDGSEEEEQSFRQMRAWKHQMQELIAAETGEEIIRYETEHTSE